MHLSQFKANAILNYHQKNNLGDLKKTLTEIIKVDNYKNKDQETDQQIIRALKQLKLSKIIDQITKIEKIEITDIIEVIEMIE